MEGKGAGGGKEVQPSPLQVHPEGRLPEATLPPGEPRSQVAGEAEGEGGPRHLHPPQEGALGLQALQVEPPRNPPFEVGDVPGHEVLQSGLLQNELPAQGKEPPLHEDPAAPGLQDPLHPIALPAHPAPEAALQGREGKVHPEVPARRVGEPPRGVGPFRLEDRLQEASREGEALGPGGVSEPVGPREVHLPLQPPRPRRPPGVGGVAPRDGHPVPLPLEGQGEAVDAEDEPPLHLPPGVAQGPLPLRAREGEGKGLQVHLPLQGEAEAAEGEEEEAWGGSAGRPKAAWMIPSAVLEESRGFAERLGGGDHGGDRTDTQESRQEWLRQNQRR